MPKRIIASSNAPITGFTDRTTPAPLAQAIRTGDLLFVSDMRSDEQPAVAYATRRRVLEFCAESRALLFPTHFTAPHVVAITCDGHGFAPKFVSPNQ